METENKKMRVDRIEEGLAVAYTDDGQEYTIRREIADLKENDLIMATVSESGEIVAAEVLETETAAKKEELRSRLKNLFNK